MKYRIVLLLSLFLATNSAFAQKRIHTKATVKAAHVYRNAAELESSVAFSVPEGLSQVVIGNISEDIVEKSLRIRLEKRGITILSSQFTDNYTYTPDNQNNNPILKGINDSISIVKKHLSEANIKLTANQKTLELLDKNQTILVGSNSSNVAQLTQLTEFYTKKRIALESAQVQMQETLKGWNDTLKRLKRSLTSSETEEKMKFANGVLLLKIVSKKATNVALKLNYLTSGASWKPFYEIEGNSITEPLKLNFKATLKQNTGVDWKGVKLSLINGMPSKNNTAPVVSSWFLHIQSQQKDEYAQNVVMAKSRAYSNMELAEEVLVEPSSTGFNINSNQLNVSYDVDIPYDILSNNEEYIVNLYHQEIPANYTYFSAPNYNKEAFLIAKVKDFSKYGLVAATANILFENMYIGETYINPNETDDTVDITLGGDSRISIQRENLKNKSGKKFLSSYQVRTVTYDLIVKNNKNVPIEIEVKDRFPISQNDAVTVTLLNDDNAQRDEEKGILTWKLKIAPAKTKKLRVSYKVKYPKDYIFLNF